MVTANCAAEKRPFHAAPIAGFILRAYRMAGIGVLVALAPPLVALFLTSGVYHPY